MSKPRLILSIDPDRRDVFYIRNAEGAYWMGPRFARHKQWEKPTEPTHLPPCWMTSSKEAAEAQLALLEIMPEPSHFEELASLVEALEKFSRDGAGGADIHSLAFVELAEAHARAKAILGTRQH